MEKKLKEKIKYGIILATGAAVIVTGAYLLSRGNVRERVYRQLSKAEIGTYTQDIGDSKVSVSKNTFGVLDRLEMTIQNLKTKEEIKIEDWEDYGSFHRFNDINYIKLPDGTTIYSWGVSNTSLKPYEQKMDEKLGILERELSENAALKKKSLREGKERKIKEIEKQLKEYEGKLSEF